MKNTLKYALFYDAQIMNIYKCFFYREIFKKQWTNFKKRVIIKRYENISFVYIVYNRGRNMKEKYCIPRRESPYIVAHRGVYGANVPCNTLASYQTALSHGADVIELDVSRSKDGELFVFHPGMERVFLETDKRIPDLTAQEVKELRLVNYDHVPTTYPVPTFAEALALLKDKAYINVDKFWTDVEGISKAIKKAGVEKQVIVKSLIREESLLDYVEKYASEYMFMAIVRKTDTATPLMQGRNINYIGTEVLFRQDDEEVISDEYIRSMHERGYLVWVNSILYNERDIIAGDHTDDMALWKDPDRGWGWLIDKKVDFIQTDWVLALKQYMQMRK